MKHFTLIILSCLVFLTSKSQSAGNILLPVKTDTFKAEPVAGRKNVFRISFEVYDTPIGNTYELQWSRDGNTWQRVEVTFPDAPQPDKLYTLTVEVKPSGVDIAMGLKVISQIKLM